MRSSLPGLTRQSIDLRKDFLAKKMDARVKPAHDEFGKQLNLAPMGLVPAIHALGAAQDVDARDKILCRRSGRGGTSAVPNHH
jgi:hypothetical protein